MQFSLLLYVQTTMNVKMPPCKTAAFLLLESPVSIHLGRVVRKPVNAKPGLKVNRSMHISCIETFFTAYVLCYLRLFKFKTE